MAGAAKSFVINNFMINKWISQKTGVVTFFYNLFHQQLLIKYIKYH